MKNLILLLALSLMSCQKTEVADTSTTPKTETVERVAAMPVYDHIVVVWFENKPYSSVVGSSTAPFMNSLMTQGTLFTNYSALQNPSQPNYIGTFAGTRCGVSNDNCQPVHGFTQLNMYTQLRAVGKRFNWYSETMPSQGYTGCQSGKYVRKHNPTPLFANVPDSINKTFAQFPTDYNQLPQVAFVSPNLDSDGHDKPLSYADTWFKNNFQNYANWCVTHNSLLVLYWDEGVSGNNRMAVTFVGYRVKANTRVSTTYNHYNLTHTIISMYGGTTPNTASSYANLSGWYN